MGIGSGFSGVKRSGLEADSSPPASGDFKNGEAIPPLPRKSSLHIASLIKHIKNFIFTQIDAFAPVSEYLQYIKNTDYYEIADFLLYS
jgi:hypothetical protein